jgi:hypothetical protein
MRAASKAASGSFGSSDRSLDDCDVLDTVLLQALAESSHHSVVDIDGEHAPVPTYRARQTACEEAVAGSDVGDRCPRPDTHLGDNHVNVLPPLATAFLGSSILSKQRRRRNQARETGPAENAKRPNRERIDLLRTRAYTRSGRDPLGTSSAAPGVHVDRPHPRLPSCGQLETGRPNHVLHPPSWMYESPE